MLLLRLLAQGKQHQGTLAARMLLAALTGLSRRIPADGELLVVWAVPAPLLLRQQTHCSSAEMGPPWPWAARVWVWCLISSGRRLSCCL